MTSAACSIPGCDRQAVARGWCKRHWQNWNRNGDPVPAFDKNENGKGSIRDGYRYFTRNYRAVAEHVEVAERALGKPLPKGAVVHHVDHDRANNTPTNLVICPSTAYHTLLHRRERARDACGNPDYRKCWICKRYDDPAAMTKDSTAYAPYYHRSCRREWEANRRAANHTRTP
jgi:hypothetical protein